MNFIIWKWITCVWKGGRRDIFINKCDFYVINKKKRLSLFLNYKGEWKVFELSFWKGEGLGHNPPKRINAERTLFYNIC